MSGPTQGPQFRPADRIAAWARATEDYAESLEDEDLANVYFGKSLGLWQAVQILSAEDPVKHRRAPRIPSKRTAPADGRIVRRGRRRRARSWGIAPSDPMEVRKEEV